MCIHVHVYLCIDVYICEWLSKRPGRWMSRIWPPGQGGVWRYGESEASLEVDVRPSSSRQNIGFIRNILGVFQRSYSIYSGMAFGIKVGTR